MISRGSKQGAGRANLKKREEMNELVRAKNRDVGQAYLRIKEKKNGCRG